MNECEFLCNKQIKEDTRQYLKVQHQPKINVILRKDKTKHDLAKFHHASLYSPVQQTLIKAINNNQLTSFPELSSKLITKNLPPTIATEKGHLNQERQNIQSIKPEKTYEEQLKVIKIPLLRLQIKYQKANRFVKHWRKIFLKTSFQHWIQTTKKQMM